MAASAAAASVVSKGMAVALPPAATIPARVASMPAAFRPLTTTWAPQPASARAMDRPSPRDAPVTSATLPSSEKSFVTFDLRFAPVYSFGFRGHLTLFSCFGRAAGVDRREAEVE